jgi:phosphoenolpyruvate carboxykinase (ATP)
MVVEPRNPRPFPVRYLENPTQDQLRALTLEHTPSVLKSSVGSIDKISRNKSRVAQYTYVVTRPGEEGRWTGNAIDPDKSSALIERQRKYIEAKGELIAIDGYMGLGERAFPVTWLYTLEGANIAGMQQILSFTRKDAEPPAAQKDHFKPLFRLIYTPDLMVDEMPGRQAILVDMDCYTTYVMGPDYFGESKKGVLRMLCWHVYQMGGLLLHAGAKAVTRKDGRRVTMTVKGLSGTGKTTTTFSKQGDLTEPIQDDMVALWPKGQLSITENGCFAKTEGLSPETEPVIHQGTISGDAWVENAFLDEKGQFDFSKKGLTPQEVARYREIFIATGASAENVDQFIAGKVKLADVVDERGTAQNGWDFVVWTGNGRSIIPMSAIPGAADLRNIPPVKSMGILNRDEGADAATPGIVRFTSPEQAAGFFMIGETTKTSAAGKDRGKTRSPFTQPFFPGQHGLQAKRFSELAATMSDVTMWMMNTGYVGGDAMDVKAGKALKVKIPHSSAMLEALLAEHVKWKRDPDFGYEIVDVDAPENRDLVEKVPVEILEPRRWYEKNGKMDLYRGWVAKMKEERKAFLQKFDVDPEIVAATTSAPAPV